MINFTFFTAEPRPEDFFNDPNVCFSPLANIFTRDQEYFYDPNYKPFD